jgi:glutathione S-transferase
MLQELEIDFDAVSVNLIAGEHRQPAFLEINPAGKVPALVDGDLVLTESVAIVMYLADKYPDKKFVPADREQRAQLNRWLMFTATELEQPLWRITRHTNLYPESKRLLGDVALAREEFTAMAAVLDEHMQGRQFLTGHAVTAADFVLAYTLDWANELKLLEGFPPLKAYMERMYARPHAPLRIAEAFRLIRVRALRSVFQYYLMLTLHFWNW